MRLKGKTAAGFNYHFVKPVDSAELEAAIDAGRKPVKLSRSSAGGLYTDRA